MKKKTVLVVIIAVSVLLIFLFASTVNEKPKTKALESSEEVLQKADLDFWIITDPHYISKELYDQGEAFQFIQSTAAGKDLIYQTESLQALIAEALAEKPDGLIVTGDVTLNGEKISAEAFAKLLSPLRDAGIQTFIIPGNHDIYDGWARKYTKDKQEKTAQISPDDFRTIFAETGYKGAAAYDEKSLSYMVQINDSYNFVFLDTNIYTIEPSNRNPVTAGKLSQETKAWLDEQLKQGESSAKTTLVFMHHNLFSHNERVNKGYVLNNAPEIKELLKKYKVPAVFSGHIHAQDILTDKETGITEIVTGSFSLSPHPVGVLSLKNKKMCYYRKETDVDRWAQDTKQEDENLLKHHEYLENLFIKDGEAMAYRSLLGAGFKDEKKLDEAAAFVGKLNLSFFTGEDSITDEAADKLRNSDAYQTINEQAPELREYIDTIIQDKNDDDLHFEKSWN
ncbi:metallophosphoesterase [Enterococcus sp. LJL128]|uniref:metallophosphoesterase n=1 Tax=Enterococcus sp. LJL51 TaxID=3416656 RepID=UPI003CFAA291